MAVDMVAAVAVARSGSDKTPSAGRRVGKRGTRHSWDQQRASLGAVVGCLKCRRPGAGLLLFWRLGPAKPRKIQQGNLHVKRQGLQQRKMSGLTVWPGKSLDVLPTFPRFKRLPFGCNPGVLGQ